MTSSLWRSVGVLYHLSLASITALIFTTNDLLLTVESLFSPGKEQFGEDAMMGKLLLVVPLFLAMDLVNRLMKSDTIDVYLGRQKRWHRWIFYFAVSLVIMTLGYLPNESHYYARF